jgi:hypothetical protein
LQGVPAIPAGTSAACASARTQRRGIQTRCVHAQRADLVDGNRRMIVRMRHGQPLPGQQRQQQEQRTVHAHGHLTSVAACSGRATVPGDAAAGVDQPVPKQEGLRVVAVALEEGAGVAQHEAVAPGVHVGEAARTRVAGQLFGE